MTVVSKNVLIDKNTKNKIQKYFFKGLLSK